MLRTASVTVFLRPFLKVIGLVLFVWLLSRIDRTTLIQQLQNIDALMFLGSFALLLLSYLLKVVRWHMLLRLTGLPSTLRFAWETYNIGTFLGLITPGKVGEFGRAGYVKKSGTAAGTAVAVVIVDRIFDVIVIAILGIAAVGILFGMQPLGIGLICLIFLVPFVWWGMRRMRRSQSERAWISFFRTLASEPLALTQIMGLTVVSWIVYCVWSLLLAASIGFLPPVLPFVSAIILAGVIALLPIAPSGLGTRDASLIWMLAPLGIDAAGAIALAFLMFVSIVLSSLIGAWYWVRGVSTLPQNRLVTK